MSSAPHTERPWGKAMDFLVETAAASAIPADTTLYLFGSALRRQARPEDLDVLLVYPDGCLCQAHVLAESLRNAPTLYVMDVLVLSCTEERERMFVRSERALQIWTRRLHG